MTTDPQIAPAPALTLLRGQDAAAFELLVAATQRIVFGLGQSLGIRNADLDDAASETYLAVYRALPTFEGRSAITTWVYQIASRTMIRARSRLRKQQGVALSDVHADPAASPPESGVSIDESNAAIWSAVAELEPRSAMAVELHYRRDMPIGEIALALNCPAGTVKTLLFRARAVLRERLAHSEVRT